MNPATSDHDPIDALADEFLGRHRRGERPAVDEYAARHPDLAERIRDLFPALLALEKFAPALAAVPDEPPARLGDFRIVREVGRGGMGVVYEAVQESLGRPVALKVLPPGFGRRADAAEPGGDAPAIRLGLGKMYARLGRMDRDLGKFAEAKDELGRGEAILSALAAEQPDDPVVARERAFAIEAVAGLLRKTGDRLGAVATYRRLADLEARRPGGSPKERADWHGNALNSLAVALWENGQSAEAAAVLRECVTHARQATIAAPADLVARAGLAMHLMNLGLLQDEAGQFDAAEAACREAVTGYESLVATVPDCVDYRVVLANGVDNHGVVLRHLGRLAESANAFRRTRDLRAALVHDFPDLPAYRYQLAQAHNNLADTLIAAGRTDEAARELAAAVPLLERLAANFPAAPEYQAQLAVAYANRGAVALSTGRPADALADYDRAIAGVEARADVVLKSVENRRYLAASHAGRAEALAVLGRHAGRFEFRVKRAKTPACAGDPAGAVRAADEPAGTDRPTPEQTCWLAEVYAVAAGQVQDDPAWAEAYAVRAVELARRAVAGGYPISRLEQDADLATLRGRPDFPAVHPPAASP